MTAAIVVVLVTMLLGGLGSVTAPRDMRVYVNGRRYYQAPRSPAAMHYYWHGLRSKLLRREPLCDARMLEPPYAPDGPAWVAYTRCQRSLAREGRMHEAGRKHQPMSSIHAALIIGGAVFAIYALFSKANAAKLAKSEPEAMP